MISAITMKKIIVSIIITIGTTMFLNAQISNSHELTPSDLIIRTNGEYDTIGAIGHFFTDEIGNPQLPVKIVSFVLPYESTVIGLSITTTQQQLGGSYYILLSQDLLNNKPQF